MLNAFSHFSVFLIHFVFGLYLTILLFRLILQIVYADYHNPLVQFIIKYTQPLVRPVQKIISGFKGVDFAILFLAFCFALVEFSLILLITKGTLPENFGIFILSLGVILKYLLIISFCVSFVIPVKSPCYQFLCLTLRQEQLPCLPSSVCMCQQLLSSPCLLHQFLCHSPPIRSASSPIGEDGVLRSIIQFFCYVISNTTSCLHFVIHRFQILLRT